MTWQTDLNYGNQREQDFIKLVPFLGLEKLPGTKADFKTKHGFLVELKSERRTAAQTQNIAVEVVSSFKRKGAIFNAVENKCILIAYMFSCNSIFAYDAAELLLVARAWRRKYGHINVRGSSAKIVLLPRKMLEMAEVEIWQKTF